LKKSNALAEVLLEEVELLYFYPRAALDRNNCNSQFAF